jgi:glutamyl/glutaminyl-tRNA synthetase
MPHRRFRLAAEQVLWDDLMRGAQHVDEASQSDPVLVHADGSYLYSFTSVVDDIALAISHARPDRRCRAAPAAPRSPTARAGSP